MRGCVDDRLRRDRGSLCDYKGVKSDSGECERRPAHLQVGTIPLLTFIAFFFVSMK